jgi:hypothetical protein
VDGPEFDGATVDFAELADRLSTYRPFEQAALEHRQPCHVGLRQPSGPGGAELAGVGQRS